MNSVDLFSPFSLYRIWMCVYSKSHIDVIHARVSLDGFAGIIVIFVGIQDARDQIARRMSFRKQIFVPQCYIFFILSWYVDIVAHLSNINIWMVLKVYEYLEF